MKSKLGAIFPLVFFFSSCNFFDFIAGTQHIEFENQTSSDLIILDIGWYYDFETPIEIKAKSKITLTSDQARCIRYKVRHKDIDYICDGIETRDFRKFKIDFLEIDGMLTTYFDASVSAADGYNDLRVGTEYN